MKLRNRNTGEVVNFIGICVEDNKYELATRQDGHKTHTAWYYDSLKDLLEEWEDYEEPKNNWLTKDLKKQVLLKKISELLENEEPRDIYFIDSDGNVVKSELVDGKIISLEKQAIGNYFKTKEEAKKAVEKLKAWKRLKDKHFKFYGWDKGSLLKCTSNNITFACDDTKIWAWEDIRDDLDLLFGGEE